MPPFDDPNYLIRYEPPADSEFVARLRRARELLVGEWLQGTYAKTREDEETGECDEYDHGNHPDAVAFCAIGALQHVWQVDDFTYRDYEPFTLQDHPDRFLLGIINEAEDPINNPLREGEDEDVFDNIPDWNDSECEDVSEVLAAFDAAIEYAQAKGL